MTAVSPRSTTAAQDAAAAEYAFRQIGKPYNWNFYYTSTRNSFYCSQLVWAAYIDLYRLDLNTPLFDIALTKAVAPTEFIVNTTKTYVVWSKN